MPGDQRLRSKLFFLDTQTYVARNFQFHSGVLERLQAHLEEDDCHLLITDVNVREVRRHLKRKAVEAVATISRAKKDAMILRNTPNLPWHSIFKEVTEAQIYEELTLSFDAFLRNRRVETIATKDVDVNAVFDAYFDESPPFATSGKKAEFPDAFVLHAINAVSKHRGHKLYVVSEDRDIKSFCAVNENLISVGRLEELLELVLKNSERLVQPAKFAEEVYIEFEAVIKQRIKLSLNDAEFELDDDTPEAEVNSAEVEQLEYLARNLTDVSKEGASFELITRLSVLVDMSFPDYDRSPWDPEDKYHPFVFHNKLVRRYTVIAPIIVQVSWDDGVVDNAAVESIDAAAITDLTSATVEQISYREMDFSDDEEYGH